LNNGLYHVYSFFRDDCYLFNIDVTSRKILRAAVFLLFVLVSTSVFISCLIISFLQLFQLTLYAGGIVVLIIFSILLTSHISQKFESSGWKKEFISAIAAATGAILPSLPSSITNFLQLQRQQER